MSKLKIFEAYGPTSLKESGWFFDALGVVFDYYSRSKITTPNVLKLMLNYVDFEISQPDASSLNGVASYFYPVDVKGFLADDRRGAFEKIFPIFRVGVEKAFSEFSIDFNLDEIFSKMKSDNFIYTGVVKKIDKNISLVWEYDGVLKYSIENNISKDRIGLFCKKIRIIDHAIFFSKVEKVDDRLRVYRAKSFDYWSMDFNGRGIEYVSPKAEAGDAHHQYIMAKRYLDGDLVKQDLEKMISWAEKSAAQGYSRAQKMLNDSNNSL